MGSRILANTSRNTKIAICCSFMILAAAGAWSCPFTSAAGIQTYSQYSTDGGIIQSNQYLTTQSSGNIGDCAPGQETLIGYMSNGMVSTGYSGVKGNVTIDANDHQVYQGDTYAVYKNGGITWDTAYMEGKRLPIKEEIVQIPTYNESGVQNGSYNYTPGGTRENTSPSTRPYEGSALVEKITMGNSGTYMADKIVEQGSNETTDYITLNAKAMGNGTFINNVNAKYKVGFIGTLDNVNYDNELKQHEITPGKYNATSLTTVEAFYDAFGGAAINPTAEEQMNIQLGLP